MTTNHTAGPWKIDSNPELPLGVITDDENGYGICEIDELLTAPEKEANAKLIAAAPCLLDALTQLMDRLNTHGSIDAIREEGPIEDARQAIIKATK